jgi:hypothetical protein
MATGNSQQYGLLANRARERMDSYASSEKVWPLLKKALDTLAAQQPTVTLERTEPEPMRRAS